MLIFSDVFKRKSFSWDSPSPFFFSTKKKIGWDTPRVVSAVTAISKYQIKRTGNNNVKKNEEKDRTISQPTPELKNVPFSWDLFFVLFFRAFFSTRTAVPSVHLYHGKNEGGLGGLGFITREIFVQSKSGRLPFLKYVDSFVPTDFPVV